MKRRFSIKGILRSLTVVVMMLVASAGAFAFEGSAPVDGQKYYLFNIYQAKFLGANNKLQAPNIGTPIAYSVSDNTITIGSTTWTLSEKDSYYQLKNSGNFFAFEDKVADPNEPEDENRAMYLGGGVACQPSANDTDRSYWQLISEDEYAEWQAKKKFTVASLNVDGMPKSVSLVVEIKLNPDAKEGPGATLIGKRLAASGFDVAGLSEDFNFHDNIMAEATGAGYDDMSHRGGISVGEANLLNFAAQKPLFDSDGLGLVYKTAKLTPSKEAYVQWNDHNGYTDNGADGLIKKGYRYYLVTLADGTEIDLYTMHMDADDGQADRDARASQLAQLVAAIKATNNKRPVVIIGDSNTRYTRDKVKSILIDGINEDSRFTIRDPWIKFGRGNEYPAYPSSSIMAADNGYLRGEVVDKIWYINNTESDIRLVAETYHQDLSFVDDGGSPLCDHKPCVVTFSYHPYDPVIDDVVEVETSNEPVFLRNRATGRFLMNGGWWGSHAVVGNYPKPYALTALGNGKYDITSAYGHITDAAYVDNNNANEYIAEWTILQQDGYSVLAYNQNGTMKALTTDDPTSFNNDPLYRYVTTAPLNVKDQNQQWEIVTQDMYRQEIVSASATHPVNVTNFIKSANFDRIDWNEHGSWVFDNKGNNRNDRVKDNGIGGIDNDAFCNYNRSVSTRKYGTSSANQWDCYQVLSVPSGYYMVTCQGFAKGVTNCGYFYAWSNPEGSYKEEKALLSVYDAADFSEDTQAAAGRAFDAGKYTNKLPVIKVGTDGHLVIGVKKTENNSTSGWFVFDNFQLYYLGTENPNRDYDYDVIESAKPAFLLGDADHDGEVDLNDVHTLADILSNALPYDQISDLNGDGKLTIADLVKLVEMLQEK